MWSALTLMRLDGQWSWNEYSRTPEQPLKSSRVGGGGKRNQAHTCVEMGVADGGSSFRPCLEFWRRTNGHNRLSTVGFGGSGIDSKRLAATMQGLILTVTVSTRSALPLDMLNLWMGTVPAVKMSKLRDPVGSEGAYGRVDAERWVDPDGSVIGGERRENRESLYAHSHHDGCAFGIGYVKFGLSFPGENSPPLDQVGELQQAEKVVSGETGLLWNSNGKIQDWNAYRT
ncbi:hypothetical protein BDY19DRAFT_909189 [Irpex rosettiformis]|uniref:Uncharacterized protein n=1 Tax=Irpex rosettiformis TaxID=378272 RepID=A0ACB8TT54_9APHY|nr:hypothetical protein BDY19DRAFT_909189 [Irpex rosettiformis]